MINIAVFASGNGSNAVNLAKTFNSGSRIRVALCLTDKEDAPVIEKMRSLGVTTEYFPRSIWRDEPQVILDVLRSHDIRLIALAGFLCYVDDAILSAYEGRILNIHPSLLPAYGGKGMHGANLHRAVIENGETRSGATVHIVTSELDGGPIVLQREVEVLPEDTPESLEARIHEIEYVIYPEAILKSVASLPEHTASPETSGVSEQVQTTPTPPPVPRSVDDAWAEALGVPNNIPPVPHREPVYDSFKPSATVESPTASAASLQGVYPKASAMQAAPSGKSAAMPSTYLVWSVLATVLCCTVPGIVAIIMSSKVSSRFYQGDVEGSQRASRLAEIWIIISFVLGVISQTLYLPLAIAGIF